MEEIKIAKNIELRIGDQTALLIIIDRDGRDADSILLEKEIKCINAMNVDTSSRYLLTGPKKKPLDALLCMPAVMNVDVVSITN